MKSLFFVIAFTFLVKAGFTQTDSLVGGWYWNDSTKAISLFFKPGGKVGMHSGSKGGVILAKDVKEGVYTLKGSHLTIQWNGGEVQNNYLKYIDKYSLQITFVNKQNTNQKQRFIFRKVVDEEVKED